ncbi:hypothetical protein SASPL_105699 [Salvia splendens]|uniref:HSP20-like chaperones superfamily protein n=1 Tax=Salvia splendens TaxID=180675 RepID=A0A8X8YJN9_SALSN|nr:hypothetical protein SASPL_105699 [Salvia splendens]
MTARRMGLIVYKKLEQRYEDPQVYRLFKVPIFLWILGCGSLSQKNLGLDLCAAMYHWRVQGDSWFEIGYGLFSYSLVLLLKRGSAMGDALLTTMSMENHHPSTLVSMDSSALSTHGELNLEMSLQIILTRPPDINLPLAERSPPPLHWNPEQQYNIPDVGLGSQMYETETFLNVAKVGRKIAKRVDSIWGAWFFFSFYFKPLDTFMVQHDMENMYMWVFKERPENALGKMQLRSYMNGYSRQGERPFPFCVDRGFVRSHRMQRKHYRGLSNPQCVHGVEASDYGTWRNLPNTEFELDRTLAPVKANPHSQSKKLLNGSVLNLSAQLSSHVNGETMDASPVCNKRKRDFFPHTNNDDCYTTYEDEGGYLILISLPFVDLQRVKVSWRNTLTHGIIKVSCTSTSPTPFITRHNRTFKLTDISSEHCPPGEFVRDFPLSTRIPEDAKIEAYYDGPGTVLEILVPKLREWPEEHEVHVCLRPLHDYYNV